MAAGDPEATRVRATPPRLDLWVGPPGSGKTTAALAEFAPGGVGRLWIAPNAAAGRDIRRALARRSGAAVFGVRVETFEQFCGGVITRSGARRRLLPAGSRRRLLRDVVDSLSAAGRLDHFRPIAATAGFLKLVEANISDFKRNEIWPEVLEESIDATESRRGLRDLIAIYTEYQRRLREPGGRPAGSDEELFDDDGRQWAALEILRGDGARRAVGTLAAVVVDGFSDLSATQIEITARLTTLAGRAVVTLPDETSDDREALFETSRSTSARLTASVRKLAPDAVVERTRFGAPHPSLPAAVRTIAADLFAPPGIRPPAGDATGLRLLTASGPRAEVRAIAADLRRRCETGLDPADVVVVFRDLARHADGAAEAFADAGVPCDVDAVTPLSRTPAVRLIRSLLSLESENWPFATLAAVAGHGAIVRAFGPETVSDARVESSTPDAVPWAVTRRLRRFDFDRGHIDAVRLLTDGQAPPAVAAWAEALDRALEPLRTAGALSDWADRLFALGSDLRLGEADATAAGWSAFRELLGAIGRDDPAVTGGTARPLRLSAFNRLLDDVLDVAGGPPRTRRAGGVRVISASLARGLDVPHLYYADLTEGSVPSSRADDCLLGETDRKVLEDRSVPVASAARRRREEMLLFLATLTRARRSLTLCRTAVDGGGETVYPSPYWTAVTGLFAEPPKAEAFDRLDPVAAGDGAVSREDRRLAAVEAAREGKCGRLAAIAGGDRDRVRTVASIAAAARATAARTRIEGPTAYDGRLASAASRRRLATLFPPETVFSASRLEDYAGDPFAFFLTRVLDAVVVEPPGPREDRAALGTALHAALAAFEAGPEGDEADLAREIVTRLTATARGSLFLTALRTVEGRRANRWAERYLRDRADYAAIDWEGWDAPPEVAAREIGFGLEDEAEDGAGDRRPPLYLGDLGHRVALSGRIDRVDLGRVDGRPAAIVIDYKSGRSVTSIDADGLASGRDLQLAVYARAAAEIGLAGEEGEVAQIAYWGLREGGFKPAFKYVTAKPDKPLPVLKPEQRDDLAEAVDDVVPRLVAAIRAGHFVPSLKAPRRTDYATKVLRAAGRTAAFAASAERLDKAVGPLDATASEVAS